MPVVAEESGPQDRGGRRGSGPPEGLESAGWRRSGRAALDAPRAERLRALLHRRPRAFGKPTSVWTLDLAAEVSFERWLTPTRVSGETIRATLARLGLKWERAKRRITSPDPEYARN